MRLDFFLDHAAENHGAVGADREEEHDGHDEGGGLVVGAAALDLSELDVGDRYGLNDGEQLVGVHPGGLSWAADNRPAPVKVDPYVRSHQSLLARGLV